MAETPEERLARLRREVEASWTPPAAPAPSSSAQAPSDAASLPPVDPDAELPRAIGDRAPAAPAPVGAPPAAAAARPASVERPSPAASPAAIPPRPEARPTARPTAPADESGWGIDDLVGGRGIGGWIAIGLIALGGWLLFAQLFPGISFAGSLVMAVAGAGLLFAYLSGRLATWALYAGAVLAGVGAVRVLGDILPFTVRGETALGIGIAFLGIAYLRHTQAGGYGWQGVLGAAALALGCIQLALGLLPGSPTIVELIVPAALLGVGLLMLLRQRRAPAD